MQSPPADEPSIALSLVDGGPRPPATHAALDAALKRAAEAELRADDANRMLSLVAKERDATIADLRELLEFKRQEVAAFVRSIAEKHGEDSMTLHEVAEAISKMQVTP
jgi:hypothetical protein